MRCPAVNQTLPYKAERPKRKAAGNLKKKKDYTIELVYDVDNKPLCRGPLDKNELKKVIIERNLLNPDANWTKDDMHCVANLTLNRTLSVNNQNPDDQIFIDYVAILRKQLYESEYFRKITC